MATGRANDDLGFEDSVLAGLSSSAVNALSVSGATAQRVGNQFMTAVRVQVPRVLQEKHKQLLAEATLAGESFYYGWGVGKDRVLGPSIGLAMAAARVWGNCAVDFAPMQQTDDAWIFTAQFVDLETGFTLSRQFRQSKNWSIAGKYDQERKDDMRFQIGQSKAARNVVMNALPRWLIDAAVAAAQNGVRARIEKYINDNGLPAAVDIVLKQLKQHGVSEEAVLAKCQVAKISGLDIDHVVMLRGDLYSLQQGTDRPEALFPSIGGDAAQTSATSSNATATSRTATSGRSSVNDALDDDDAPGAAREVQSEKAKVANEQQAGPTKATRKPRGEAKQVQTSAPPEPASAPEPEPTTEPASAPAPKQEPASAPASAPAQSPTQEPEPASEPTSGDEGPAVELPNGFRARLKACRAPAEIDALLKELDVESTSDAQWKAMSAMAEKRRLDIREATRRGT